MVQPPAGLGDPFWVDDPDFRLASHVESYTGAGEAMSLKSFRALTDALLSDPLDLRRPLWHLVLVPRLEDGRTLTNPDLIWPGLRLRMPGEATPRPAPVLRAPDRDDTSLRRPATAPLRHLAARPPPGSLVPQN